MAKVPNTLPVDDTIGVEHTDLRPCANTRVRHASPTHRWSDTRSGTITCSFNEAAVPHGPASHTTGAPLTAPSYPGGSVGPAPWRNVPFESTSRIEQALSLTTAIDKAAHGLENVLERTPGRHHLEEPLLAGQQSFGALAPVDVGEQNVPADDLAVRTAKRQPRTWNHR